MIVPAIGDKWMPAAVESPKHLVALEETPRFTYWWDLITQPDYQPELDTQLPGPCFRAVTQNV